MQLAIGDTLCRKIQIGVASRNRRKFCRKTLWAHFPAIYKIRHCFQHTFYPALTAIISQWSLVTENKCLASTRTIADFARMPEISGIPAYTPLMGSTHETDKIVRLASNCQFEALEIV